MYDLRTNIEKVTKGHRVDGVLLRGVRRRYGGDPNGHPKSGRVETDRFRPFPDDIRARDENLDIFWLRDESLESGENLPDPETILSEIPHSPADGAGRLR